MSTPANSFDTVLCINVLEHIQDDLAAIKNMLSVLKPGGKLLLYVPAIQWAFGSIDKALGHFRRYSHSRILSLVESAEAEIQLMHYVNFVGVLGWFYANRIRKDDVIQRSNAQLVDRMVPYLSALERLVRPPIGQSLFAVIAKSTESS